MFRELKRMRASREMKVFQDFFPVLVLGLLFTSILILAQDDQSGFISIDCGIVKGSTYIDKVTGISYVSGANFIDSGEPHKIQDADTWDEISTQLTTLTSFPENTRNCYTLKPTQGMGHRYLIRAWFMYGNYNSKDRPPEFDVYLGPDYWNTFKISTINYPGNMEIIYVSSSDYIHVCLVNTGRGTPFISAIEIRLLGNSMYEETTLGSLHLLDRMSCANQSATTIRYNTDKYDRLWYPNYMSDTTCINTPDEIFSDPDFTNVAPSEVMASAITPIYPSHSLELSWYPVNATDSFCMYMYFAEIENLESNQTREFQVYLNGDNLGPITPSYHSTFLLGEIRIDTVTPNYTLRITRTENSTLPPIINALELYTLKQMPQRQTDDRDAAAMWSIKSTYRVTRHWQGDPCAPQEFAWEGVRCSYNDTESPRIIFLNLSASGLNGEINLGLANLTMINTLDLSNNNLTGKVPKFLAALTYLKVLNLKGNHFTGPLPVELLEKSNKGSLSLSYDDGMGAKEKSNKFIVPVIATVVSFFMILTALTAIWIIKNKKSHGKTKAGTELEMRKQQYTYSEVQSITENFKVILGEGGFGTVYHGRIHDTQVAVKILSKLSHQGDKEFQAEAMLLLSIHHKNITSLVGYCNEDDHKGIIYEYMANGNLEMHLFDVSSSVLNWEERLQIGLDAAHGLEYLHHGCKPPIIHRDVKCNNILLTEAFQAKLADFGLSRAFPAEGGTHISTVVAGTPGYLDPELWVVHYLAHSITSSIPFRCDYILSSSSLLKTITKYDNENIHIVKWVNLMLKDGNVKNVVDPRLLGDFNINSAWKAVEVAIACVDHTPRKRPNMIEVVMMLSECLAIERASQETNSKDLNGVISIDLECSDVFYCLDCLQQAFVFSLFGLNESEPKPYITRLRT
ncbi:leucine-rich repeat transmembrane protein kinase protein [Artemisia annua]|uniref:non-specific serine/threonine protein kinase n=1 Tax=Artemisia annua TaxID=35608 RepID=A0A2U1PDN5_ARTAN|nr:leucine-rich repeat transmembrane protein kinase protein [Artemisia annua]